ncbi:hypothetical protein SSCG_03265 [Streptomyces clavuligerus]|nr:hypothetical protein SSCG_03265 [Streptomyces clavuligerus]
MTSAGGVPEGSRPCTDLRMSGWAWHALYRVLNRSLRRLGVNARGPAVGRRAPGSAAAPESHGDSRTHPHRPCF